MENHCPPTPRHCKPLEFNEFEQTLLNAMRPYASVVHTNELDQPITSLDNLYLQGKSIDKVQGYSVYYIFKIICYLTDQLDKLSDRKYMMPVLSEFYPLFTHSSMTTRQVISRKNWNFLSTTR